MSTNKYRILMAVLLVINTVIAAYPGAAFSWLVSGFIAGLWLAFEERVYFDRKLERQIEHDIQELYRNHPTLNFEENNNV